MKKPSKTHKKKKSSKTVSDKGGRKILRKHPAGGYGVSAPLQSGSITQPGTGNAESVSMGPGGPVVGP